MILASVVAFIVLALSVRLRQLVHGWLEERRFRTLPVKAENCVRIVPRFRQERPLYPVSPAFRVAPTGRQQLVRSQVSQHPPRAIRQLRLVLCFGMGAQDGEQPVFARLCQVSEIRDSIVRGSFNRASHLIAPFELIREVQPDYATATFVY